MNELELIISLFPLVFMIHEFEEIICLKRWVSKMAYGLPVSTQNSQNKLLT